MEQGCHFSFRHYMQKHLTEMFTMALVWLQFWANCYEGDVGKTGGSLEYNNSITNTLWEWLMRKGRKGLNTDLNWVMIKREYCLHRWKGTNVRGRNEFMRCRKKNLELPQNTGWIWGEMAWAWDGLGSWTVCDPHLVIFTVTLLKAMKDILFGMRCDPIRLSTFSLITHQATRNAAALR